MKNYIYQLTLIIIGLSITISSSASRIGAEITYKQLDSCSYEVSVIHYRWCSGVSISAPVVTLQGIDTSGLISRSKSLNFRLYEIYETTPYCKSAGPECVPQNARVTGAQGIEKHVYKDTIELCGADSLYASSSELQILTNQCCRSSQHTTGLANKQFSTFAKINLEVGPGNSSPIFTNDPIGQLCCNQPVFYNLGAIDTIDYDSLSYSLGTPRGANLAALPYSSTATNYGFPFSGFFGSSGNTNLVIPNNDPPIGIYLDPTTGDLIFTPINCSEVTAAVLEVTEWRKDSAGTPQIIGVTRRDMRYQVSQCPDNNPPKINGPYSYSTCEGEELCFNITTTDVPFVPPPPLLVPPADTLSLSWNGGIPGASFHIIDSTAREKTGRFCWTPPLGSASTLPYTFNTTVRDDACPRNASSMRTFKITVKPSVYASQQFYNLTCGAFAMEASVDSISQSTISVQRLLRDTSGNLILNTNIGKFTAANNLVSSSLLDTLYFFKNGHYILQTTLNNPSNCPIIIYDTLNITGIPEIELNTNIRYCANVAFTISSNLTSTNSATYAWYKNDMLLNGETDSILFVPPRSSASQDKYKVVAVSGGCTIQNTRIIPSLYNDVNSLPETEEACQGDIVKLNLDTSFSNIEWSTGSISNVITLNGSDTVYVTYEDSLGCVYTDSVGVVFNPLPSPILDDDTFCTSSLKLSSGMFSSYTWSTGDTTKDIVVSNSGQYSIAVIDSNGCTNTSTANIVLGSTPQYSLKDTITGCDKVTLTATPNTTVSWSTGDTTASISLFQSVNISATLVSNLGCDTTVSTYVSVINSPVLNLGNDTTFCADSFILNANAGQLFLWNTGEQSQTIRIDQTGSYWVQASQGGCVSTDTIEVTLNSNNFVPQIVRTGNTINSNLIGRHQWYRDGALVAGETVSAINVANRPGRYRALHQDQNGCFSDSSNAVNVTLGVAGMSIKDIKTYPNPTNGKITIDATGLDNVQGIKLYDSNGKLVENTQTINGSLVNLSWEALSGIYWVVVTTDKGVYRAEIVNVR